MSRATTWRVGAALVAVMGSSRSAGAQTPAPPIILRGEVRVRSEIDDRSPGVGYDAISLLRTRIGLIASPSPQVKVVVRLSDSRVFGEETNTLLDASADRFDLHEGFLEWTSDGGTRVRAGRQEWAYGDERLIGTVGWANVTRSFDGVQVHLPVSTWTVDGFAATLREFDATGAIGVDPRQNEGQARDQSLLGVWATDGRHDLFAIAEVRVAGSGVQDVFRRTIGGHGQLSAGGLAVDAMAAWQSGSERIGDGAEAQDIAAWFASLAIAKNFGGSIHPRLALQADLLSGDADPLDDRDHAFNTLYATNHKFYGFMDLILDPASQLTHRGLVDLALRGAIQPEGWRLAVDLHHFRLARRPVPGAARGLGTEVDATGSRTLAPGLGLVTGASVFRPGTAATAAGIGLGTQTLWWGYIQLTATF